MRIGVPAVYMLAIVAGVTAAACGKRGAPIPPNIRIPAAVDKIEAARLGNDVYVTLTVPATNIDESLPIDIKSVEVYGYTGTTSPGAARFAEVGTIIATIPVVAPPRIKPDEAPPPPPDPSAGALPGTAVTIVDTLTPDEFVQGRVPAVDPRRSAPIVPLAPATQPAVLKRFYLAVPVSIRGRFGPPGMQAEFALTTLPDPPSDLRLRYDASAIALTWEPSGGLLGFLLDRALPPESTPFIQSAPTSAAGGAQPAPDPDIPGGPTTYNVYRELGPDPLELPLDAERPPWTTPLPMPINPTALTGTSTTDELQLDRQRCYSVRAQRGALMSEPSLRTCFTPIDIFPPVAPAGLAAVASEGGISLIWEPNNEPDLDGYLILRREPGDATLRQLTPTPVKDARYRDTDVQSGTRYIYSVVAVDTRVPLPNVSVQSERVEETAR